MTAQQKDVQLNVAGRSKDVQLSISGRDHGDIFLTVTPRGNWKETYNGSYSVASSANEMQILDTEDKLMTENLIVLPIPYYETSNPKGGLTVFIGGD